MKTFEHYRLMTIHTICLFASFYGIYYAIDTSQYFLLGIAYFVGVVLFSCIGYDIGMHRYWCHSSFKTNRFFEIIITLFGVLSSVATVMGWCVVHRTHHKYSDTEKDIHSPNTLGTFRSLFTKDYNYAAMKNKIAKDLIKEPVAVFFQKYHYTIIFLYVLLIALINPILVLYLYCIPVVISCYVAVYATIVLNHDKGGFKWMTGTQRYDIGDKSTNSWFANALLLGSGWHNNHHAFPNRWYFGEKWYEWELHNVIIRLIKKSD